MALLYCCWSIFYPSALYWYSSLVLHILIGELMDCLLSVSAFNYYNKTPKMINLKRIYLGSQFEIVLVNGWGSLTCSFWSCGTYLGASSQQRKFMVTGKQGGH